jgi:hypothetical protein
MGKNIMKYALLTSIAAVSFGFGPASAQELSFSGEVGATLGWIGAYEVDGGTSADEAQVAYGKLDGRVALDINNTFIVALDANYRQDDFQSSGTSNAFSDDEDPELSATIGLHGYYKLPNSLVGGFVGYADTRPQDGDKDDSYDAMIYGISGQTFMLDDLLVFGQMSVSDKVRDGQDDDEGINGGFGVGSGAQYFMSDTQAWTLDFEYLALDQYIDSSDPGRGFGVTATYEHMIEESFAPIVLSAGLGYNLLSSTDQGEGIEELTASVGVRILFGNATDLRSRAETGANMDTPYLQTRMAGWTEWMD